MVLSKYKCKANMIGLERNRSSPGMSAQLPWWQQMRAGVLALGAPVTDTYVGVAVCSKLFTYIDSLNHHRTPIRYGTLISFSQMRKMMHREVGRLA